MSLLKFPSQISNPPSSLISYKPLDPSMRRFCPLRTSGNSPLYSTGHWPFNAAALLSLHFFTGSLPAGHRVPLTMCDPWMTSLGVCVRERWMGFECPCPPVRNDIVTPRHLFSRSRRFVFSPESPGCRRKHASKVNTHNSCSKRQVDLSF